MIRKNIALASLLFYVTLSCQTAWGHNFFSGLNENIASVKNKEEITIDAAIGIGSQVNSLMVNNGESLWTTNRNLYILGINVNNKTKLAANLPFKDPKASRESRIDSVTQSFSLGVDFTDNLKSSVFYRKNKGYILETESELGQKIYRLPDLTFNSSGLNFYWLFNPEHQSIYLDPYVYEQSQDSSSWITMLGFNHNEINNLQQTKQLPTVNAGLSLADAAEIESLAFRQLYSRNWFWSNWYVTGALGYGVNFDYVKQSFSPESKTMTTSSFNTVFSASAGYLAKTSGFSVFTNITQAAYKTENLYLNSNIGTTGLYYTHQF